jgi:hypothetical protein
LEEGYFEEFMAQLKKNDRHIWRSRYNHELYKLYNELVIVEVVKVGGLDGWDALVECRSRSFAGS